MLILGSMPGVASLAAGQYYAHPRNAFWPIMGAILGFDPTLAYPNRTQALRDAGIALWDVLRTCERRGSADAAIRDATLEPNEFGDFLRRHRQIDTICFNGAKAAQCFRRRVLPRLGPTAFRLLQLPSTSPAHAGMPFACKLEAWRSAIPCR